MISILSRYLECLCIAQMELSLNFQIRHLIFISLYQTALLFVGVNQRVVIGGDPSKLSITTSNNIISKKRENLRPSTVSPYQKKYLQESWKIDLIWTILCFQHVTTGNSIPNWTDFNYLFDEKEANDSCHTIGYLPAIDQSTTSFEVVAEVLRQSKVKAEALALTEVDVVMDQAICAKAVEIMLHPTSSF